MNRLGKQEYLALRAGAEVLEADHCGEKVLRLVDGSILKLFRHKRLLSSATFFPYARRFAANAAALAGLGVPVPHILRIARVPSIGRDAVLYQPLAGQTLRELLRAGIADDEARRLKAMLTRFIIMLHDKGVYFRSLHLGNVVLTPEGCLGLIDFADLRIHPWPLGRYLRTRNMRRMSGLAEERDWVNLVAIAAGRAPEGIDDVRN
ncbi:MAG: toluene tolerance protein [Rhodocyclaceae bacterium]|nr:toluene tolerance protein [Rhodocyclaceae bacterium]